MNIKSIIIALAIVLSSSLMAYAQPAATGQEQVVPPVLVEVGNKICPVSKEKVGQMGDVVKYEYNGKIYNLCCPACKKDFVKDPQKFSKIAEDEVAATKANGS